MGVCPLTEGKKGINVLFDAISDNQALSQRIVNQITKKIKTGELKPGDRLPTERTMAEQFQVSRTAIRDAIKILSGSGLLEVRHGVGIFVADSRSEESEIVWNFTHANLRDVFEVRRALEAQTAFLAAIRRADHHIVRLRQIIATAQAHSDDVSVLNDCDAQFHETVAEASQNVLILDVMWTILDVVADTRRASLSIPSRPQVSLEEHSAILDAIIEQQPERARLLMLHHLDSVESAIASNLPRQAKQPSADRESTEPAK